MLAFPGVDNSIFFHFVLQVVEKSTTPPAAQSDLLAWIRHHRLDDAFARDHSRGLKQRVITEFLGDAKQARENLRMRRREFLAVSGAMGVLPLAQTVSEAQQPRSHQRDYYELRTYQLETQEQRKAFDRFAAEAAIPALNRLGISPVGVFYPLEGNGPAYVLLTHPSTESVATLTERLANDDEFLQRGAAWLDAPATRPAYQRMESSLFVAFAGMPHLETPAESPGRVFQLRIYESPSVKTGQKKIEMFNDAGEIAIFRRVGLNPVFFGEALVGSKMPNLTYMLGFESDEDRAAAWKRFGADPQWQELRAMEEYADKKILSGITNLMLQPATYSQI